MKILGVILMYLYIPFAYVVLVPLSTILSIGTSPYPPKHWAKEEAQRIRKMK